MGAWSLGGASDWIDSSSGRMNCQLAQQHTSTRRKTVGACVISAGGAARQKRTAIPSSSGICKDTNDAAALKTSTMPGAGRARYEYVRQYLVATNGAAGLDRHASTDGCTQQAQATLAALAASLHAATAELHKINELCASNQRIAEKPDQGLSRPHTAREGDEVQQLQHSQAPQSQQPTGSLQQLACSVAASPNLRVLPPQSTWTKLQSALEQVADLQTRLQAADTRCELLHAQLDAEQGAMHAALRQHMASGMAHHDELLAQLPIQCDEVCALSKQLDLQSSELADTKHALAVAEQQLARKEQELQESKLQAATMQQLVDAASDKHTKDLLDMQSQHAKREQELQAQLQWLHRELSLRSAECNQLRIELHAAPLKLDIGCGNVVADEQLQQDDAASPCTQPLTSKYPQQEAYTEPLTSRYPQAEAYTEPMTSRYPQEDYVPSMQFEEEEPQQPSTASAQQQLGSWDLQLNLLQERQMRAAAEEVSTDSTASAVSLCGEDSMVASRMQVSSLHLQEATSQQLPLALSSLDYAPQQAVGSTATQQQDVQPFNDVSTSGELGRLLQLLKARQQESHTAADLHSDEHHDDWFFEAREQFSGQVSEQLLSVHDSSIGEQDGTYGGMTKEEQDALILEAEIEMINGGKGASCEGAAVGIAQPSSVHYWHQPTLRQRRKAARRIPARRTQTSRAVWMGMGKGVWVVVAGIGKRGAKLKKALGSGKTPRAEQPAPWLSLQDDTAQDVAQQLLQQLKVERTRLYDTTFEVNFSGLLNEQLSSMLCQEQHGKESMLDILQTYHQYSLQFWAIMAELCLNQGSQELHVLMQRVAAVFTALAPAGVNLLQLEERCLQMQANVEKLRRAQMQCNRARDYDGAWALQDELERALERRDETKVLLQAAQQDKRKALQAVDRLSILLAGALASHRRTV